MRMVRYNNGRRHFTVSGSRVQGRPMEIELKLESLPGSGRFETAAFHGTDDLLNELAVALRRYALPDDWDTVKAQQDTAALMSDFAKVVDALKAGRKLTANELRRLDVVIDDWFEAFQGGAGTTDTAEPVKSRVEELEDEFRTDVSNTSVLPLRNGRRLQVKTYAGGTGKIEVKVPTPTGPVSLSLTPEECRKFAFMMGQVARAQEKKPNFVFKANCIWCEQKSYHEEHLTREQQASQQETLAETLRRQLGEF